ncbi:DUF3800 domain-containing protein [Parabacteroides sp. OttesenSCG-928-K15]|nr:DUF3800 domain-containing protein [Parabacteroides sp. OttesenSCG-928-K15]
MSAIYNIYCDESCHLENDNQKAMVLGAIWVPIQKKDEIFKRLREIKEEHGLSPSFELKWNKVSDGKYAYYKDVANYFFDNGDLHYRALVVPDKSVLNHQEFGQTHDQFYYKMYFDLLKTIFTPNCSYNIYIDIKDTQGEQKVKKLHEVLCNNHYDFSQKVIQRVQQVRSHEVELIALADFFTGALSYFHRELTTSQAKLKLIEKIKERSGYSLDRSTLYKEDKFNLFIWKPGYGRK